MHSKTDYVFSAYLVSGVAHEYSMKLYVKYKLNTEKLRKVANGTK